MVDLSCSRAAIHPSVFGCAGRFHRRRCRRPRRRVGAAVRKPAGAWRSAARHRRAQSKGLSHLHARGQDDDYHHALRPDAGDDGRGTGGATPVDCRQLLARPVPPSNSAMPMAWDGARLRWPHARSPTSTARAWTSVSNKARASRTPISCSPGICSDFCAPAECGAAIGVGCFPDAIQCSAHASSTASAMPQRRWPRSRSPYPCAPS